MWNFKLLQTDFEEEYSKLDYVLQMQLYALDFVEINRPEYFIKIILYNN